MYILYNAIAIHLCYTVANAIDSRVFKKPLVYIFFKPIQVLYRNWRSLRFYINTGCKLEWEIFVLCY